MPIEKIFQNHHCEWLDVETPTKEDLEFLRQHYPIDKLLLEDTLVPHHLPKFEQAGQVKFFLARENSEEERSSINSVSDISTKLGIFLVNDSIITVHRIKNPSIYSVKEAVKKPQYSEVTPDKIALLLCRKVMQSFETEADQLATQMDGVENEIFLKNQDSTSQIRNLHQLKRRIGLNARILTNSSDWISQFKLLKLSEPEIADLKDQYKHAVAYYEHLNAQITNLISMFLAMSDQRANQVMKVLAIYSMYFFPIAFIAGVYGMNFDVMPELHGKYNYFIVLAIMGLISLLTFLYVRKKRW